MKRFRLRRLNIEEVSLVDKPANQGAQVLLHKRDPEGTEDPTTTPPPKDPDMKDAPEVKPDALAEMQKSLQATQDQLTTLLNKNEELAKKNTELQEVLKRNEEARAEQNRLSLAKSIVGNANVKVEDVSSLLKQLDASGTAVLTDLMKKYNAVLKQGGTLRAVGAESDDDGEMTVEKAEKVIDDATVEIVKLHGGKMSKADAYIEACRQNPDAYDVVMGRA